MQPANKLITQLKRVKFNREKIVIHENIKK